MKTRHMLTRSALFVAAMLLLPCLARPARAAKPGEIYPEFRDRRATLGSVTVLADVVVIRQEGGTPVLKRTRSQAYTDSLLVQMKDMLASKGLDVQVTQLVSSGIVFNEDRSYRVGESDSLPATELVNPPFFLDSTYTDRPELGKAWKAVNKSLLNYVRRKHDAPVSLAQGKELANRLGAGTLAIVRVSVWDVPVGKQLASLFDASPRAAHSSSFVGLTLVSGSDGMVVWDDWVARQGSLKLEALRTDVATIAKNMP